jgi:hypothetical protein
MGAWGIGPFENDDALDWVWGLDGDDADEVLATTLRTVARDRGYLEVQDGANAVAAATILASAIEGTTDGLPPEAVAYLERRTARPDAELIRAAIAALDRATGEDSEVAELWDESDDGPEWRESVAATRRRLAAAG